jgi:hypothetical protein
MPLLPQTVKGGGRSITLYGTMVRAVAIGGMAPQLMVLYAGPAGLSEGRRRCIDASRRVGVVQMSYTPTPFRAANCSPPEPSAHE